MIISKVRGRTREISTCIRDEGLGFRRISNPTDNYPTLPMQGHLVCMVSLEAQNHLTELEFLRTSQEQAPPRGLSQNNIHFSLSG